MIRKILCLTAFLCAFPLLLAAQDCKLKFMVAYSDGKTMQVGLTAEQKKFWDREGAKHFKGMCLDPKEPGYIILWSEGLSGAEVAAAALNRFNQGRALGQVTSTTDNTTTSPKTSSTDSNWISGTAYIRPSGEVRARADYWIFDTSKNPYPLLHQGQGYQDVPRGLPTANQPGQSAKASDLASTVADPAAAMESALKWLKKQKNL